MCFVYIIESQTTFSWYYGFTESKPDERLTEHNGNHRHYTANKGPWVLIFFREFEEERDALAFEKKLKSLRNKTFITREYCSYFLRR